MESSPPSSKRMKNRAVRRSGKMEGWFSSDPDLMNKYLPETSRKVINTPKVVFFNWLKEQKIMEVRRFLKEQLLRRFLELSENIYPNLVRVFYTNLQFNGDILVSHVKGVDLEITNEVWTAVTGLKFSGLKINKGNTGIVDEFNKMKFYKNYLQNPQARVTKFGVGGLKLNERLVAFIVSWILTPRGNNHSTLSKKDLVLIYCTMNKIKLNWIHIIKDHMQKATRLCDFRYPYAILITKFL